MQNKASANFYNFEMEQAAYKRANIQLGFIWSNKK